MKPREAEGENGGGYLGPDICIEGVWLEKLVVVLELERDLRTGHDGLRVLIQGEDGRWVGCDG